MGRIDKGDYKAATFRLPPGLLERLDEYAFENGLIKGFVVERALTEYLDAREKREGENE